MGQIRPPNFFLRLLPAAVLLLWLLVWLAYLIVIVTDSDSQIVIVIVIVIVIASYKYFVALLGSVEYS